MPENILIHPGAGWDVFYPANSGILTNAVQTVKASSKGSFAYGWVYSSNVLVGYIQIFDVALKASITLGTTVADYTITIAPLLYDKPIFPGLRFVNGCHIAFTTTKTGSTAMVTGLDGTFLYKAY